jgi:signal transduction histidine kinase
MHPLKSKLFIRLFFMAMMVMVVMFVVMYRWSVPFIQKTVTEIEAEHAQTILNEAYETVRNIHLDLDSDRQMLLEERREALRNIIAVVAERVHLLEQEVAVGRLTREEAKNRLLDELRQIKYGRDDYIWAADEHYRIVSHPDPNLHDTDASELRDVNGRLIIVPIVDNALKDGEGFYSYWWRRLGNEQPIEKLTYYRYFPVIRLIISTGLYIDDVTERLDFKRQAVIAALRQRFHDTRIAKTGYLYIFDGNYHMLIHPNANIEGKHAGDMIEPISGKPLLPLIQAATDQPDGLYYQWDSPTDPGHYIYEKIAWVRYVPEFDWYIGSSVYVDELNQTANILSNRITTVFVVALVLVLVLAYLFVRKITDPLWHLSEVARRVQYGDLNARCALGRKDEVGVVANAFDLMVNRLQDNIVNLDTRIRERTAELERANAELKELDRMKSDLLSMVSHELRTPLTSVIGFIRRINKKLEETIFPHVTSSDAKTTRAIAQIRNNLAIMIHESNRLSQLIKNVLDSVMLETETVQWHFTSLQPAQLLERAVADASDAVAARPLTLHWNAESDLPNVWGDEIQLRSVFAQMLSNAVKFTPVGEIALSAKRVGDQVRFSVQDTGQGIPADYLERIFDRLFQVGDPLINKPSGIGLGLSICQQIIRHHHGQLWVESELGKGSIFHFTLNLATTAAPA